jgi:hypothetical protein
MKPKDTQNRSVGPKSKAKTPPPAAKSSAASTPDQKVTTTEESGPYVVPQFNHVRLANSYPIIEIAKLAASFGDETHDDRIHCAIDMLAIVEKIADLPVYTQILNEIRRRYGPKFEELSPDEIKKIADKYRYNRHFSKKCNEILKACKRDEKQRVQRASLIAEVSKDVKKSTSEHDLVIFNDWLTSMEEHSKKGDLSCPYRAAQSVHAIKDDDTALFLISGFHRWLRDRKNKVRTSFHSRKTGKFVPASTKGADRDKEMKYSKANAKAEEESVEVAD